MDEIEEWLVRGRVATAVKRVRETLTRLATESEELNRALAEAKSLDQRAEPLVATVGAP